MTTDQKNYNKLFALSKKIRLLDSISYLLGWDQETYMPKGGATIRGEQIALVAGLIHKDKTSASYKKHLSSLIDLDSGHVRATSLSSQQQAALQRWRRDFQIASALPNSFVKKFAKLTSEGMVIWGEARKKNAIKTFAPTLEKIVSFCRKKADLLGYQEHPYDALLDCFEPEMTVAQIAPLFSSLGNAISSLLQKIQKVPQVDDSCLHGKFPTCKQLDFGKAVLEAMGFDLEKGRLDLSNHPFSSSMHPSDSRITTRIHATSLFDNISIVLHEGGHSLYEMGLMPEYYGSPLCEAVSLGIHESQSRFWETRIGQSFPFWKHFFPKLKEMFPEALGPVALEQFYKGINKVEPTFIRVESDEVTYSLHVIVRFELEKRLIEGTLSVRDLPEAWREKMHHYLGITPTTDAEGCLQDIHWSMGAFGYFPTYALGNLYAAHFFKAFAADHPDWQERLTRGDLLFIKEWLGDKIHQHGRVYTAAELAKRVGGGPLSEAPYLEYLTEKYQQIYRF